MSDNDSDNNNGGQKKRKADELEPSPRGKKLTHDLLTSLGDPDLCDVTLVGSDGGRVPAIRAILSTRSDVLKRLLVGRFKEASEEEVRMDYPSAVLKALVHFCCTDEAPELLNLGDGDDPAESVRLSAILLGAADYYDLDALKEKTFSSIARLVKTDKSFQGLHTCVLLQETSASPSLRTHCESAFFTIRRNPNLLLAQGESQPAGVTVLSSDNLFKIVDSKDVCACAWALFRAIQIWADKGSHEEELLPEDRVDFAKKCCAKLELRMISASNLLGPVAESGLVDQSAIFHILQTQLKGNAIGIYGAAVLGVNGVYEEVSINRSFEPVADADGEQGRNFKIRFDKSGQLEGTNTTFSILCQRFHDGLFWTILAPPKGASCLVLSGDLRKIVDDNRILYSGSFRLSGENELETLRDGSEIKWKCIDVQNKNLPPTMIFGSQLSTKLPTAPLNPR